MRISWRKPTEACCSTGTTSFPTLSSPQRCAPVRDAYDPCCCRPAAASRRRPASIWTWSNDMTDHAAYFEYLQRRGRLGYLYRTRYLYPRVFRHLHGRVLDVGCGIGDL